MGSQFGEVLGTEVGQFVMQQGDVTGVALMRLQWVIRESAGTWAAKLLRLGAVLGQRCASAIRHVANLTKLSSSMAILAVSSGR
jgi:hypothetical protein